MLRHLAITSLCLCLLAFPAWAQLIEIPNLDFRLENRLDRSAFLGDDSPIVTPNPNSYLTNYFHWSAGRTTFETSLTLHTARFYGIERYEVSPIGTALFGADMGATLGLFLGAIGTTTGVLSDKQAWYAAGAMAAMGALYGGTYGADKPSWRIRYRWEDVPAFDERSPTDLDR